MPIPSSGVNWIEPWSLWYSSTVQVSLEAALRDDGRTPWLVAPEKVDFHQASMGIAHGVKQWMKTHKFQLPSHFPWLLLHGFEHFFVQTNVFEYLFLGNWTVSFHRDGSTTVSSQIKEDALHIRREHGTKNISVGTKRNSGYELASDFLPTYILSFWCKSLLQLSFFLTY